MSGGRPQALQGVPLLEDLARMPLAGRRVLLRVDFNVPLRPSAASITGQLVEDDFRIRAALPTIEFLRREGAEVTVCTHLGRPKGVVEPRLSVAPVREVLADLAPGVELMENLRFDPGEESCDPAFIERLVDGFDAYVNDAFGVSHRRQASVIGPPAMLPSAAGRLLAREVEVIGGLLEDPARPFVVVIGGAKVSDKLGVLGSLLERADTVAVGGAMAFTFLLAEGWSVGESLVETVLTEECASILEVHRERLLLPNDFVVENPDGTIAIVDGEIAVGGRGLDIGPASAARFGEAVSTAATVFWNGPMGRFEDERFADGTRAIAEAIAKAKGYTVAGGGDTAAALDELNLEGEMDFVSTGGGASLDLLEHGDLPGLEALRGAPNAPGRG